MLSAAMLRDANGTAIPPGGGGGGGD